MPCAAAQESVSKVNQHHRPQWSLRGCHPFLPQQVLESITTIAISA
jgi:hypothetical protein